MSILLVAVAAVALAAQGASEHAIVARFTPYALLGLEDGEEDGVRTCHAVLHRDPQGRATAIAAMYLGPGTGEFRVLVRSTDGEFEVAAQPGDDVHMSGGSCEVEVVELDGSEPAEIMVTLGHDKYEVSWLYNWAGGVLTDLTPTVGLGAVVGSELSFPMIVDVYHDGRRQVLARRALGDNANVANGCALYELRDGHLSRRVDVRDVWWVVKGRVDWFEWEACVGGGGRRYVLKLVNGHADGTGRVSVTSVQVNGVEFMPAGGMGVGEEFKELDLGTGVPAGALVKVVATGVGEASSLTAVLLEAPQ